MTDQELIKALRRLMVQTGSLACLGWVCLARQALRGLVVLRLPWAWPVRQWSFLCSRP